ncbi:unnamed protein product [Rotaria magnacalcarata]
MGLIQRTILKLSEQTNSTLDQLGYVFVTRPFSFLGGTIYAGIIVDHFVLFSRTFLTLKILIVCLVILIIPFIQNVFSHFCTINVGFWASIAFGCLCGILLSTKLSSFQMTFIDLIGRIISLVLIFVFNKSSTILWIVSYTEEHINLVGKHMPILAIRGSMGGAVIPLLIGFSINSILIGTIGFILVTLAVIILASILFWCGC